MYRLYVLAFHYYDTAEFYTCHYCCCFPQVDNAVSIVTRLWAGLSGFDAGRSRNSVRQHVQNGYASTFHSNFYFLIIAPVVSAITAVYSEFYLAGLLSIRLAIKLHKNNVRHMTV